MKRFILITQINAGNQLFLNVLKKEQQFGGCGEPQWYSTNLACARPFVQPPVPKEKEKKEQFGLSF
jgi:hypothetical protein